MSTTAIIDAEGVVQDMILAHHADVDPQVLGRPDGWTAIDGEGGAIGDTWDGTQFVRPEPPTPPVPEVVSRAQGKAALVHFGKWGATQQFVASMAVPADRAMAEIYLNDTQEWRRDNVFLNATGSALGLTDAQMDELFRYAATVQL